MHWLTEVEVEQVWRGGGLHGERAVAGVKRQVSRQRWAVAGGGGPVSRERNRSHKEYTRKIGIVTRVAESLGTAAVSAAERMVCWRTVGDEPSRYTSR